MVVRIDIYMNNIYYLKLEKYVIWNKKKKNYEIIVCVNMKLFEISFYLWFIL